MIFATQATRRVAIFIRKLRDAIYNREDNYKKRKGTEGMNILVTGATGWLGSRFVEIVIAGAEKKIDTHSWEIKCLVPSDDDVTFLKKLEKNGRLKIVNADITKRETLVGLLNDIDVVFHVAGLVHPKKIKDLYEINTKGTENLLVEAEKSNVKRFIYISSNSVAGINKDKHLALTEETPPNPYLSYGKSKYLAENIVNNFNTSQGLETVILRPCWFYGPNQPARQTTFFKMIEKGSPIIFGSGHNLRSMSYVDNTCQAMLLAATEEKAAGQTYWISDKRPYTTLEIYQTIADILKVKKLKPKFLPDFVSGSFLIADKILQKVGLYIKEVHVAGEMNKDIFCSNDKAIRELGYEPKVDLREGMKRSIDWCKDKGLV